MSHLKGGKTGWPPGLLQDDCRALGKWFASRPGARRLVEEQVSYASKIEELIVQRDALRAELAALRKDAERYRWLRARIPGGTYRVMGVIYSEGGSGVDSAIDAAMAGEGKAA